MLPEFYELRVKGQEKFITKWLKYESIAILHSVTKNDNNSFLHNTHVQDEDRTVIKSIMNEGIKCIDQYPLPLGKGIYVWHKSKSSLGGEFSPKCFAINNYEGQYLQLVYYDESYFNVESETEYVLLKLKERNITKMWKSKEK